MGDYGDQAINCMGDYRDQGVCTCVCPQVTMFPRVLLVCPELKYFDVAIIRIFDIATFPPSCKGIHIR